MNNDAWTRTPNLILDNMASMKPAVFKICMAVVRKTYGYTDKNGNRKVWDRISTSQFMNITGLSNRAVIDAIEDAVQAGWIVRRADGQWFEYSIPAQTYEKSSQVDDETYEKSSQVDDETYEKSSQESYEKSSQVSETYEKSSQKPMKKVHTQKKKEKSISTSASTEEKPPSEQQKMFEEICNLAGWDYRTLDKGDRGQVAKALEAIKKAGYTLEDLRNFWPQVWANDWRWQKHGQRPTVGQIRQEIGKLRATAPTPHANGSKPANGEVNLAALLNQPKLY